MSKSTFKILLYIRKNQVNERHSRAVLHPEYPDGDFLQEWSGSWTACGAIAKSALEEKVKALL